MKGSQLVMDWELLSSIELELEKVCVWDSRLHLAWPWDCELESVWRILLG